MLATAIFRVCLVCQKGKRAAVVLDLESAYRSIIRAKLMRSIWGSVGHNVAQQLSNIPVKNGVRMAGDEEDYMEAMARNAHKGFR